jgi:putative phage-type endonuclease
MTKTDSASGNSLGALFILMEVVMKSAVAVPSSKPRPALKLVKTNDLSRDEWLEVRKTGIGSSDAAASVGLNPYQSQLELWMVKTGRGAALPQIDPNDDTSPMFWGTMLEAFVAAHYTKKSGNRVRKINAVLQHPVHAWMLANIDREIMGSPEVQILECKTAGMNGAKLWRDGVPDYVQLQVQHQLAVTSKAAADVAVLVCGNEYRSYRIERDDALIARLIELERKFWHYVETDTQPPADGSDSADVALRCLYPQDYGAVLDLSGDIEMCATFADLNAVRAVLSSNNETEAQLKQKIQQRMGDSSKAVFDGGEVTWKRSKDGVVLDTDKLLAAQPDILQRYPLTRSGSRRFLIST